MPFFCKKAFSAALLLFLFIPFLSALPSISDFLTDEERAELNGNGEITLFHFEDTEPELMPEISHSAELRSQLAQLGGNFSIEGIFFIPEREQNDDEILLILNILSRVSRLEGLQYYSASREEMRLLFEECWRIEDPKSKEPLEDLQFTSLPEETTFYIHQKDLTFGSNRSAVEIKTSKDSLLMSMENTTNMKINGVLRVMDKGNFHTDVMVIPTEEGILYYGVMTAKTLGLSFIVDKASQSFYNRMKALFNWFSAEYESE